MAAQWWKYAGTRIYGSRCPDHGAAELRSGQSDTAERRRWIAMIKNAPSDMEREREILERQRERETERERERERERVEVQASKLVSQNTQVPKQACFACLLACLLRGEPWSSGKF